jgi:quercetin dioxygenase-like cupin family protein
VTDARTLPVVVSHARDAAFTTGLRAFFAYRDLGIRHVTGGKVGAHVIRAVPGTGAHPVWHTHDLHFQMVYVLKGWVRFEYEGSGEVLLEEGSMVHQPPGIRHREVAHSDDLELLEITLPASFATAEAEQPS